MVTAIYSVMATNFLILTISLDLYWNKVLRERETGKESYERKRKSIVREKQLKEFKKMKFAIESAECYDVMNRPRDVVISPEYLGQFETVMVKILELR